MFTSGNAEDYNVKSLLGGSEKYTNGLYNSPELAAYAFGAQYNEVSIAKDREHGAVILCVDDDGMIAYTWKRIFVGGKRNVLNMWLASILKVCADKVFFLKKSRFAATVHTHASCGNEQGKWTGNGTFFFSPNDMKFLPNNKFLIAPDGAMHYAEGKPSIFRNRRTDSKRDQKYYEDKGWWYGEILGYGLPFDPLCGPYME